MLEFHLKNLRSILEKRDKAVADGNYMEACYYDNTLAGCIYYLYLLYVDDN